MNQKRMFETEDLPLFSGTAPKGNVEVFDPSYVDHIMLSLKCKLCFDTGLVQVRPGVTRHCWCEIGQKLDHETNGGDTK